MIPRVHTLKARLARGEYRVDAAAVAEALLARGPHAYGGEALRRARRAGEGTGAPDDGPYVRALIRRPRVDDASVH